MNRSTGDGRCGDAGSLSADLSNLVAWAHTHGAICSQIPALEILQSSGHPGRKSSVLWMCGVGHAYYWPCGKLDLRREENEAVERRKRLAFPEASSREADLDGKRLRMAPSFEGPKAGAVSTEACSRSPGVTQQKGDTIYVMCDEPAPRENLKRSSTTPCVAAEQHLSASGGGVQIYRHRVKTEGKEDVQVIPDENPCESVEDDQGDRINQNILSESPVKGVTAEAGVHRSQQAASNTTPATQTAGFAPAERPLLPRACLRTSPVSSQESLDCHGLSTAAKAQPESPACVTFFEVDTRVDVQQQLWLSPAEPGTPGMGFSGSVTENIEESRPSGSGHAQHPSASRSPGSRSAGCAPAPPNNSVLVEKQENKKYRNSRDIKIFKDWLVSHCPSETLEIHRLPPEHLDHYLALFYSSAKRQDGRDFSANSLIFFQSNIDRYLKDRNYEYSVAKGSEFRMSQDALKLKVQQVAQKETEGKWSALENLTDDGMECLRKKGLLGKNHPHGLLHLMFTNLVRGFGARTHRQGHGLRWGQLVLKQSEEGLEYLEWRDDASAEASEGQGAPRLLAKPGSPESCPVAEYKEYARRRPPDMLHDYDPLYLAPKPLCSIWDQVWYCRKALSGTKMESILKVIVQQGKASGNTSKK